MTAPLRSASTLVTSTLSVKMHSITGFSPAAYFSLSDESAATGASVSLTVIETVFSVTFPEVSLALTYSS